jgi:PAS domain S-box-containing protein
MGKPIRVLMVEDSENDAALLLLELRRNGYDPRFERVETRDGMNAALRRQLWDVVIADYHQPQFSAPDALALLRQRQLDIPFIVLSGSMPEEIGAEMMEQGADDYVMKDNLARLVPAIERELSEAADRRGFRLTQNALRESALIKTAILAAVSDPVIILDSNGMILEFNRAAQEAFEIADWEARGTTLEALIPSSDEQQMLREHLARVEEDDAAGAPRSVEIRARRSDGSQFPLSIAAHRVAVGQSHLFVCTCKTEQHARV